MRDIQQLQYSMTTNVENCLKW